MEGLGKEVGECRIGAWLELLALCFGERRRDRVELMTAVAPLGGPLTTNGVVFSGIFLYCFGVSLGFVLSPQLSLPFLVIE
jgi:hypothetical protein